MPSTVVLQQACVGPAKQVSDKASSWLKNSDQCGHEWIRRQVLEIVSHQKEKVGAATFKVQEMINAKNQQEMEIGYASHGDMEKS